MKDYVKWHKYSTAVMLISMAICIYSGHKMIGTCKKRCYASRKVK